MLFCDGEQVLLRAPSKVLGCNCAVEDQPFAAYGKNQIRKPTSFATGKEPNSLLRREVIDAHDLRTRPTCDLLQLDPPVLVVHVGCSGVHRIFDGYSM